MSDPVDLVTILHLGRCGRGGRLAAAQRVPLRRPAGLRSFASEPLFPRPTGLAVGLAQERSRSGQAPPKAGSPRTTWVPRSPPDRSGGDSAIRAEMFSTRRGGMSSGARGPLYHARSTPSAVVPRARAARARALARARRLPRVDPPPRGRAAVRLLRGPADRQRAARARTTCWRASSRTCSRATRRCAATSSRARRGWDCHGLPVELEIEKELGFHNKHEIEGYGVAEFNAKCRESVLRYIDEWNALTERIGFWIDTDDAYFTLANDYIESVWWSLKQVWEKGLLYEGHKVVPYCPRCGTALSSHELALGYQDVVDPSVYVRFPLVDEPDVSLLAWTTTPWTLVPNAAIAVDPEVTYVRARLGERALILAEALVERVLGEERRGRGAHEGLGAARHCATSRPSPTSRDYGERGHTVLAGDFVTTEDGTGVVHTGAAFGEDDFRLATDNGLTIHNPVRPDGTFDERTGPVRRACRARGGRPRSSRRCASPAGCSAPASTSTPTRTAGAATRRSSTTRSRAGTCARPPSRTSCWPRTRRSTGTPSTSSTGASATGSRTTSTGRCRASATGARRCRSGAADEGPRRLRRLARRDRGARRQAARGPAQALHRRRRAHLRGLRRRDAPRAGADRRLVGLRLHAVRPVARAVRERGQFEASASRPTTSARRSTRRAAGSTRCSRSRRCCSASRPTRRASASA